MDHIHSIFKDLNSNIEGEIERLTLEKRNLESEVKRLTKEKDIPQKNYITQRVLLDIGGKHFSTTVKTLTSVPGSFFCELFNHKEHLAELTMKDGRIFLDRNGGLFRHILNCLRDPKRFILRLKNKAELDELRVEAQFYGIESLLFVNSQVVPDVQGWLDEKKISVKEYSSQHSESFPASNVLNYGATYWLSLTGQTKDQWITFDFEKDTYLSKISIKVDYYECTVKDFSIQYSEGDDLKTWVTIKDFQAKCGNQCSDEQFFEGFEFRGRYMRLFCKNNWGPGGGDYILITNVKFFGALMD